MLYAGMPPTAATEKTKAALSSVLWSALLTGMKLVIGLTTGSLGILSEALHSGLDFLAAAVTLYAVRIAARPADVDHPYGHGKIENLSALGETLLLLATAAWIITEAFERLLSTDPGALHIEVTWWAFAVVAVSLLVDVNRAAMLHRVAVKHKSQALEADAAHFATDIWSSAAVLLGLVCVALVPYAPRGSWIEWLLLRADIFAALVVSGLILHVCYGLGKNAVNALMDGGSADTARHIKQLMEQYMPHYPLALLRVRESGEKTYVEMAVSVPKSLHMDTAHEIADAIEELIRREYPKAEVMVHMEPEEIPADLPPDLLARQVGLTHRFGIHSFSLVHAEEGDMVMLDIELPPGRTLEQSRLAVRAFQSELCAKLGVKRVIPYIEPDWRELPEADVAILPPLGELRRRVDELYLQQNEEPPENVELLRCREGVILVVTQQFSPKTTVADSHEKAKNMKRLLQKTIPGLSKATVEYRY